MWIRRRESEIGYRISSHESDLRADIQLAASPGPSECDIDAELNMINLRRGLLARGGHFLENKLKGVSFDTIATTTGGLMGAYAQKKFPGALGSVLPDLPEVISYLVYSGTGAVTGHYVPRVVGFMTNKTVRGYRWFRSEFRIG